MFVIVKEKLSTHYKSNVLAQVRFATSKTKLDVQYNKFSIRVAARDVERHKIQDLRKLGIYVREISNLGGNIGQCQYPLKKSNFGNSSQKTAKCIYQTFLVLPNFTGIHCFIPNILSMIVGWFNARFSVSQKKVPFPPFY